ncbi:MAG TPA: DUF1707 domain-containing protein [Streptosporangiaceae bacterium]|jgi:hypothetical protein
MAPAFGQSWTRGPSYGRRAGGTMRVSDAERSAVADELSKHFSDGRLDEAEFQQRLDQAMHAKTQADLGGLFDDLPAVEQQQGQVRRQRTRPPERPRRQHAGLLLILLVVIVAATAGQFVVHFWFPWLLVGLLVFLALRGGHHHHHHDDDQRRA